MSKPKEEYSPAWCPHVKGIFTRAVDPETGAPEPTWVTCSCGICGDIYRVRCESGAPRQWVLKFATLHVHRDALRDPFPKQEKKR